MMNQLLDVTMQTGGMTREPSLVRGEKGGFNQTLQDLFQNRGGDQGVAERSLKPAREKREINQGGREDAAVDRKNDRERSDIDAENKTRDDAGTRDSDAEETLSGDSGHKHESLNQSQKESSEEALKEDDQEEASKSSEEKQLLAALDNQQTLSSGAEAAANSGVAALESHSQVAGNEQSKFAGLVGKEGAGIKGTGSKSGQTAQVKAAAGQAALSGQAGQAGQMPLAQLAEDEAAGQQQMGSGKEGGSLLAESLNNAAGGAGGAGSSGGAGDAQKSEGMNGFSLQPQDGVKPDALKMDDQLKAADVNQAKEADGSRENKDVNQARLTRVMSNAVQQKGGVVTMRLSPHELGVVRIEMEMSEGVIKAQLSTEKEGARDMLRLQMNDLKQTLESQGFKVEKLEVSTIAQSQESSNESGKEMKDDKSKEFDRRHDSAGQQSRGRRDQKPGENHSFQSVEEEMTLTGTEFAEQIDRA